VALAELLAELERRAAEESERLLAEADAEAARRAVAGAAASAAERRIRTATAGVELEAAVVRELATTRRETATAWLEAERRLVERVLSEAERRLALPEWIERSAAQLGDRLPAALALAGVDAETLEIEPAIAPRAEPHLDPSSRVRLEPISGTGAGFRVRTAGGVEIDDCWRSRLARLRPELELELARRIEEGVA
jgi:hypothetical protein